MAHVVSRSRVLLVAAFAALMVAVVSHPAYAQVDASTLTGPMQTGATTALTAGFAVAAILLVGFLIYKAVRRFTG